MVSANISSTLDLINGSRGTATEIINILVDPVGRNVQADEVNYEEN
jgi:hypothetical protein